MADPATQFQPGGMGIGYQSSFEPLRLNPPIQLQPADWGQVGRMALAAGQQIQNSALNPAVREKMKYDLTQYKAAEDHIAWLQANGRYGQMAEGTGPEGLSTVPLGTTGVNPMLATRMMMGPPKPPAPPAPETTTPTPPTPASAGQSDFEQHPDYYFLNPTTGSYERRQDAPPVEHPAAPKPATQPEELPVNPGDLLSQTPPAAPSMFAGRTATPPAAAPSAPVQPTQPSTPGTIPGSLSDQYAQQQLADWQGRNQGGAASARAALEWAQTNRDTDINRAVYMDHGGPGGQPAFAFYGKKGGSNIVPLQQMVQSGFAPEVVAQNISPVLSQSQRVTSMPSGAGAGAIQGSPAAQPTPMLSGAGAGAPQGQPAPLQPPSAPALAQATPMPSGTGVGAPPGPPAAPGPQAYNAAAYQMPQGPTVTQTGAVNPALMAGGSNQQAAAAVNPVVNATAPTVPDTSMPIPQVSQEDADANIFSKVYSAADLAKMSEDPTISNWAGFTWKQDRRYGNVYAVTRSPSNIFREDRWNWGKQTWEDTQTDKSGIQQELHDIVASVPGDKLKLDDTQILAMPSNQIMSAIDLGKRFKATGGEPQSITANHIQGEIYQSQSVARLIEMLEAAKKAGIDPRDYSQNAVDQSKAAAERDAIMPKEIGPLIPIPGMNVPSFTLPGGLQTMPMKGIGVNPWDALRWGVGKFEDLKADRGPVHPIADAFTKEAQFFGTHLSQTPGITYSGEGKPENRGTTFEIGGVPIHLPAGTDTSSLQQISRIFQGQPQDDVITGLKQLKYGIDDDLGNSIDLSKRLGFRASPSWEKAFDAIKSGQNIADDTPRFKVEKPTLPTVDLTKTGALDEFIKNHGSGTQFLDQDGNTQRIK